jgi:hypothetical protein
LLDVRIDDALRQEGLAREFVRLVQECRKEAGFEVSDRIELLYEADPEVLSAIEQFAAYIQEETLAVTLATQQLVRGGRVHQGARRQWTQSTSGAQALSLICYAPEGVKHVAARRDDCRSCCCCLCPSPPCAA